MFARLGLAVGRPAVEENIIGLQIEVPLARRGLDVGVLLEGLHPQVPPSAGHGVAPVAELAQDPRQSKDEGGEMDVDQAEVGAQKVRPLCRGRQPMCSHQEKGGNMGKRKERGEVSKAVRTLSSAA